MATIASGVSFPSYAAEATWSGAGFDPDFPPASLNDLLQIRRVALRGSTAAFSVDFALPASRLIDFLAIAHHNAGPAATVRIQLSSGVNPAADVLWDSGALLLRPHADLGLFRRTFPHRLPAPISVRSGRLTFSANDVPLEIGAVEIGRFWEWPDVNVEREIGIASTAQSFEAGGGVEHVTRQWSPRTVSGQRKVVDRSELDTTLLDFQRSTGLWRPFIWCWDMNDPTTWAREAMLVTNSEVAPGVVSEHLSGSMSFALREHLL